MPDMMTPFYRNGKPIELTIEDYAHKTGMSMNDASLTLQELRRQGKLQSCIVKGLTIFGVKKDA